MNKKTLDLIRIVDWIGNELYQGRYDSPRVDEVLEVNRCSCDEGCDECDNTGYKGDFSVSWIIPQNRNVYEFIYY